MTRAKPSPWAGNGGKRAGAGRKPIDEAAARGWAVRLPNGLRDVVSVVAATQQQSANEYVISAIWRAIQADAADAIAAVDATKPRLP